MSLLQRRQPQAPVAICEVLTDTKWGPYRDLTVKLRGRATTPDRRRGRTLSFSARGAKQITPHGPLQRLLESRWTSAKVRAQRSRIFITQELVRFGCGGWIDAQQAIVKHPRVHVDVQMRYLLVCRLANGVPET